LVSIDSGCGAEHYFEGMKKLLFLGACLVALASQPVIAQTDGTDIVVVKVTENYGLLQFDIARAGSKPEHRQFNFKQLREVKAITQAALPKIHAVCWLSCPSKGIT
jgi:hypothetical protein